MSRSKLIAAIALLAGVLSIPQLVLAQSVGGQVNQVFHVGIDADKSASSGCDWTRANGSTVHGIDLLMTIQVDPNQVPAQVVDVSFSHCENGAFGDPIRVGGGWPVGSNVGVDGSDAIEAFLPLGVLGRTDRLTLYVDASSNLGGTDALDAGLYVFAAEIPTLGAWGLGLLLVALLAAGILYIRLRRRFGKLGLTALLGLTAVLVVLAMVPLAADGDVADWAGIAPLALDPTGDSSDTASDLAAFFAADDGDDLFVRIDVVDIENHPPDAVDDAFTVAEDSVANALDVLANDTDIENDPLTITATGTPSAGGSVSISGGGTGLSYTPAANFFGTETFTYTIVDSHNSTDTATVTMTVTNVNDNPDAVDDAFTVLEDASTTSLAVLTNDLIAPDSGETLTVTGLGATSQGGTVAIAGGGTSVNYTPAADVNGTETFTYTISDGNGGSDTATVTVTITPVNDAPAFTKGADQTVLEDAGAQSVAGWATAIGDGDDGSQTLTFNVTANTNSALFSVAPAVDASGTLTYTTAANANGSADITLTLSDNGGTANGGVDTSAPQTFTINVTAVNDAPSFTSGGDVTVLEDAGPQRRPARRVAWASNLSAGPTDENAQVLTFNVTGNTNNALFATQPSIDASTGELSFESAANGFGSADITVTLSDDGGTANGGDDTSDPVTFTITITGVNDPPSFTVGADPTVLEDAGASSLAGWATNILDGDGGGQVLTFNVTGNTNPGLFSVAPAVDASTGTLTFTSAADANGTADITLTLSDDGGSANGGGNTSAPANFTITVTAVNDAPTFTAGGDQTILEDAGPQKRLVAWASAMNAGPADESGQNLTFNITGNTNPGLFSAGPSIDASTGILSYTAAADAVGTATITVTLSDNGGTANGGADTSAPASFDISVTAINDEPSFTSGGDVTYVGAAVLHTESAWATAISAGPADESGQVLSFNVTGNTNPGLFTTGPAVDGTSGDLTFTPVNGMTGSATITLALMDDGGTANGGDDTSPAVTFDIDITAQNQEPSFTAGADETVLEDAGAQTVNGWATNIDDGDGGGQVLSFNVTGNTNPGLFAVAPAVDPTSGNLTYTPAANANGSADITLELMDDGGTAGGGDDTSAPATFTITVTAVNDVPSFTPGADESVNEDAGAQTVNGWATAVSAGPADESGQTLTFNITGNTLPALFSAGPAIDSSGNLTYTPTAEASGTATITVTLSDNGGTANGGVDTSAAIMFDIVVNAVADPPVAGADSGYKTHPHITLVVDRAGPAHGHLVSTFTNVLDNDSDPDSVSFAVTTIVGSGDTTAPFTGTTTLGGTVEMYADGSFHYHPPAGASNTTDTFQYTVEDTEGASTDATVSIDIVNEEPIWFVDTTASGGGDGTIHTPFNNVTDFFASAQNDDDVIYLYRADTGTTPIDAEWALAPGQTIHGEGNALNLLHPEDASPVTLIVAGSRPVLTSSSGDVVTLDTDCSVLGVEILAANDYGIIGGTIALKQGPNKAGAVVIDNCVVTPQGLTDGVAFGSQSGTIDITNSDLRGAAGHMGNGVILFDNSATITISDSTLGSNGTALRIYDPSGSLIINDSTIDQTNPGFNNQAIRVSGSNGGSISFTGTTTIMVDNLSAGLNGFHVDASTGELDIDADATASISIDASGGNHGMLLQSMGAGSVVDFACPVDITGAGQKGLTMDGLSGSVGFGELAISGATGTHLEITNSDADFTIALDGTDGIESTGGRALSITSNTGGHVALSGGPIVDADLGIDISSNAWDSASSIANDMDIDNVSGTGLSLLSNTGGLSLTGTITVDCVDVAPATISFNDSLTISDASLVLTDGGGGGGIALDMTNNTALNVTFSTISGVNTAGKGVNLATNTGITTIGNLNLTTTGGIGLDVSSGGTLNLNNGGGGTATINTTNALGLDIDNTTFGSGGGTSTLSDVQVSGTGGGINFATTSGTLIISDTTINVSGATGFSASSATVNIDPNNTNSATITATGQRAFQLTSVTTTGFNFASTTSTGSTSGITASSCNGTFSFGDTTITSSGNGVDLSSSPVGAFGFEDLDVTSTAGVALAASSVNTVGVDTNDDDSPTLAATTRPVLDIDNCTIHMNLATLTSTNSTTHGVDLTNILANSTMSVSGTTTVTSPTSIGINIDDVESGSSLGLGNFSVTNRGSHGIFIQDHDGTLIGFGDADITNGLNVGGDGVHVQTSGGGATSTGSVSFTSLDISSTNAVTNRLDGGGDGIPDNETHDGHGVKLIDHTGGLIVTGDGTQGNGGTIQNIEGDGICLIRSGGLNLDELTINNIGTSNQAAASTESGGIWAYNLVGSNAITNSTISRFQDGSSAGGSSCGVFITNNNTSFTNFHVTDTTFFNDNSLLGDDAIQLITNNAVSGALIVDSAFNLGNVNNNSEFYQISGTGVQVIQNGSGTLTVSISDTTFRDAITVGGFGGIDIASSGSGILSSNIDECLFLELYSGGVNNSGVISLFGTGTVDFDATVNNCTFGSPTQRTSDGRGAVRASTDTDLAATVTDFDITITNNTIDDTDREAISLLPRGGAVPLASGQTMDFIVTGNDIGQTTPVANDAGLGREGIEFVATESAKLINMTISNNTITNFVDSSSDETLDIKVNDNTSLATIITGNTFNQSGSPGTADSIDVSINSTGSLCLDLNSANTSGNTCPHGIAITETAGTFNIEDIGGAAIPAATVDTFVEARNTGSATVTGTYDSCNSH